MGLRRILSGNPEQVGDIPENLRPKSVDDPAIERDQSRVDDMMDNGRIDRSNVSFRELVGHLTGRGPQDPEATRPLTQKELRGAGLIPREPVASPPRQSRRPGRQYRQYAPSIFQSNKDKHTGQWLTAGAGAMAAFEFAGLIMGIPKGADAEGCDDLTHESVGVGTTWGGSSFYQAWGNAARFGKAGDYNESWGNIAQKVSAGRYAISGAELALANRDQKVNGKSIVTMEDKGVPADALDLHGDGNASLCLAVPKPQLGGQVALTKAETVATFEGYYDLADDDFERLNPAIDPSDSTVIPAGTMVNWARPNKDFVLQVVPKDGLKSIADGSQAVARAINDANWAINLNDGVPQPGDLAYLPPQGSISINGKDVPFGDVLAAYK